MSPFPQPRAALFVALLGTIVPLATAHAAEPPASAGEEGRTHFLRGVDFSRDGDFRAALIEFRRAYETAPNYRVLYNIGQTALEIQDYGQSLDAFEKYLAEGGTEIPAARRTQVEAEIERLQRKVSQVKVVINVPNASVFLDDAKVGTSPLERPLRVGAGRHKVSASSSEFPLVARVIDVAGGETATVEIDLRPSAPAPVAAMPDSAASTSPLPPEAPPSRTALWIGVGVTGALAVGTTVAGILAQSAESSFEAELARYPGNKPEISSARSSLQTTALLFDVGMVATLIAGGVTVAIALSGTGAPSKSRSAFDRSARVFGSF